MRVQSEGSDGLARFRSLTVRDIAVLAGVAVACWINLHQAFTLKASSSAGGGEILSEQLAHLLNSPFYGGMPSLAFGSNETKEDEDFASACLIVMDDNHFLIEWIAYHYHVLKLRHLIVVADPKSQTSPQHVLDRWKKYMEIEIWTDDMFHGNSTESTFKTELKYHRSRQWAFNVACLKHLKSKNRGWTILIDVDEYIAVAADLAERFDKTRRDASEKKEIDYTPRVPPIYEKNSIFDLLQQIHIPKDPFVWETANTPCISMPRRQFTNKQAADPTTTSPDDLPQFLNATKFQTLRWKYPLSGKKRSIKMPFQSNPSCRIGGSNIPGKNLIDLQRLRLRDLNHPLVEGNPHVVLPNVCTSGTFPDRKKAFLFVHQYIGTKEEYFYRGGDRRGYAERLYKFDWLTRYPVDTPDDRLRPWLSGFVASVGSTEAQRLLKGVGDLEPLPSHEIEEEPESATNPITFEVGEKVKAFYKGVYLNAMVAKDYGGGNYHVVYSDCEEAGLNTAKIRKFPPPKAQ